MFFDCGFEVIVSILLFSSGISIRIRRNSCNSVSVHHSNHLNFLLLYHFASLFISRKALQFYSSLSRFTFSQYEFCSDSELGFNSVTALSVPFNVSYVISFNSRSFLSAWPVFMDFHFSAEEKSQWPFPVPPLPAPQFSKPFLWFVK